MNHHTATAGAGIARSAGDTDTAATRVGTAPWVQRTSGRLTAAERRSLLRPLARTHAQNAVGRLRLAAGLYPGIRSALSTKSIVSVRGPSPRPRDFLPG